MILILFFLLPINAFFIFSTFWVHKKIVSAMAAYLIILIQFDEAETGDG